MSVLTDKDVSDIKSGDIKSTVTKTDSALDSDYVAGFKDGVTVGQKARMNDYDCGKNDALETLLKVIDKADLPIQENRRLDDWETGYVTAINTVRKILQTLKDGEK